MTIYTKSVSKRVGNRDLHVLVQPTVNVNLAAEAAGNALERARLFLQVASGEVCQPNGPTDTAESWAADFFCPDGETLNEADWAKIKTVITNTRTGLEGDVMIKAGLPLRNSSPGTAGKVMFKTITPQEFVLEQPSKPHKTYQSFVASMKPRTDGSVKLTRRGAIHIRADRLVETYKSDPTAVLTLVHEATHKFAGTWDYRYFKEPSGTRPDDFTDKASALGNADSYAWFVLYLNKKDWSWE